VVASPGEVPEGRGQSATAAGGKTTYHRGADDATDRRDGLTLHDRRRFRRAGKRSNWTGYRENPGNPTSPEQRERAEGRTGPVRTWGIF
jgi:hypothetical protein